MLKELSFLGFFNPYYSPLPQKIGSTKTPFGKYKPIGLFLGFRHMIGDRDML